MTPPRRFLALGLLLFVTGASGQPFGLSNRVAVTTLKLPLALPVFAYTNVNALGSMTFSAPVAIVTPPGETNRLFVIEQPGRIVVVTNLASPTRTVFMDLGTRVQSGGEQGLLGLAFHPGYLTNRYFFIFYTTSVSGARHDRLARFEISPDNPNAALTNTEAVLISQPDDFSNHNGGDLHFGPDGYLYVSVGDEGDANDTGANSQRINKDFFAGILRLDVDKLPGSLAPTPHPASSTNYAVPADNPFVGATSFNGLPVTGNVRTEFWAVGLRNPWRFSFDELTGWLFVGDVGQGAREEVNVIVKGGNYGWNYREGNIQRPGSGVPPAGFSGIPPILDYARTPSGATNVGVSITGGVVYRGNRIPRLSGAYVFADYGSGNLWAARYDGSVTTNVPFARLMVDAGIAAFGIDPANGDVLYADVTAGVVRRLIYTNIVGAPLPATLADTGAFADPATLTPHAGFVPYDVNVPAWADNASVNRWVYVPTNRQVTFRATNNWSFPTGSVWIQHFELELTNGAPASRRRLETRFLVRDGSSGVYGLTYRWDSPTNAIMVPEAGLDEAFVIDDGGGLLRTQVWHYPARAECLVCHTPSIFGGQALGFNTPQLNRDHDYGGIVDNQLRALANARYFDIPVTNQHNLRALTPPTNEAVSVEHRVRSWLTANCVGCHQTAPASPGGTTFDTRIFAPLSVTRLINGVLGNNGGDPANRVVVPGDPMHSMLLTRIATPGAGRMPPLSSSLVDTQAIALLTRWITNDLPAYRTFAQWQMANFGSTNAPAALAAADPDLDGSSNWEEYLAETNPADAESVWAVGIQQNGGAAEILYPMLPNRGVEVYWNIDITNAAGWKFLNVPENRPFLSATNGTAMVPDVISNAPAKFYRGRVFEP